jgi:hypothetical protein
VSRRSGSESSLGNLAKIVFQADVHGNIGCVNRALGFLQNYLQQLTSAARPRYEDITGNRLSQES